MNDVVKKIEKSLREYDPTIKFSGSSALKDLMIDPLSSIMAPFQDELYKLAREQSMLSPESISEAEMDRYAANFLTTRVVGAKATGNVRIYFRSPKTLYLDPNVYFETNDGKRFYIQSAYSITEGQMAANISEYPYYSTGLIPVITANYGLENETGPNTIKKIVGITTDYAYVKNSIAITGGVERETNTQLKSRIQGTVINKSISSDLGIQSLLTSQFTSLKSVTVVGSGDEEMTRDLVYSTASGEVLSNLPSNFYRSDFFGAISGIVIPPANRSRGYWGVFYVEVPTGSGLQSADIPDPELFTDEWPTDWYASTYRINDGRYQTINTDYLLRENWQGGVEQNDTWLKRDGTTLDGKMLVTNEIEIINGRIRLGKTVSNTIEGTTSPPKKPYEEAVLRLVADLSRRAPLV